MKNAIREKVNSNGKSFKIFEVEEFSKFMGNVFLKKLCNVLNIFFFATTYTSSLIPSLPELSETPLGVLSYVPMGDYL